MGKFPAAKKSLGQHFLTDPRILQRIAGSCDIGPSDTVVEIGPGRGHLTRVLAGYGVPLYCLELDRRLISLLQQEFLAFPNVHILHQDCLTFDLRTLNALSIKVVGNIPYYLSTPLIEHLFRYRSGIGGICIMVQKEFARRMVARPGSKEYGSLSCFVQYHCDARILFPVSRGSFFPAPGVDSALVRLIPRQRVHFESDGESQEMFFRIVRASFGQRRKMLKNALNGNVEPELLTRFLSEHGMSEKVRAEELSLDDFVRLVEKLRGE